MTLLEIKTAAAAYHGKTLADLTQLGLDLGLMACNQAKQTAQLGHDFNFQRKILTLSVNSATGASLDTAVIQGTSTVADIKTIINVGVFDTNDNFRPVTWMTAEAGQERMLQDNRYWQNRWAERDDERVGPSGAGRFVIRGGSIFAWPIGTETPYSIDIGIEAYVFDPEWEGTVSLAVTGMGTITAFNTTYYLIGEYNGRGLWANVNPLTGTEPSGNVLRLIWYDTRASGAWVIGLANDLGREPGEGLPGTMAFLISTASSPAGLTFNLFNTGLTGTPTASTITSTLASSSDVWTTKGAQYILWQTVCNLNKLFKTFVPRTEGNLSEPQALADAALAALILWDDYKLEGFRTHKR